MAFWDLDHPSTEIALIDDGGGVLTYHALAVAADAMEARLPRVGERSLGFLILQPSLDAVAAYLACLRSRRHVPLLIQPGINSELLAKLIDTYRPNWVMMPAGAEPLPEHRAVWTSETDLILIPEGQLQSPLHPDLALLLSTSGSTGSEKLVRLSYTALKANARAVADYLEIGEDDRTMTTLPLAYSFGMSVLNSYLEAGASLILTAETLMSREFWRVAAEQGITSLSGVPSTFEMLRRVGLEKRGLTRLRTLTQAGGAMRPDLVHFFDELAREQGWRLFVMYGQTEAAPRISYVPPDKLGSKIGSIGIAIPGGQLEIDPQTSELVYCGANVMMGYAEHREELAKGDDCHGILRTGDLAESDEDGFFYLKGRLKRFIKVSGARINLDAVEARLSEHFGMQVVCTGSDDRLAVSLLEAEPSDEAVLARLRELFNIFPGFVRIQRVDVFPLTKNGKIDYRAVSALSSDRMSS